MLTLTTLEGKTINLKEAKIVVSENDLIASGYYMEFRLVGMLPRCRKPEVLTYMMCYNSIAFTTLFGYRAYHHVDPKVLKAFLDELPVERYRTDTFELTPELIAMAHEHVASICNCPAVIHH